MESGVVLLQVSVTLTGTRLVPFWRRHVRHGFERQLYSLLAAHPEDAGRTFNINYIGSRVRFRLPLSLAAADAPRLSSHTAQDAPLAFRLSAAAQ